MLDGISTKRLRRLHDERGSFAELFRADWKDILGEDKAVQANFSTSHAGIVRAWHRHLRGQIDFFVVLKGHAKICAYDEETRELVEITSSSHDLQIVRIPGHYWHGFKVVGGETVLLLYFTNKMYDHQNPDEERRPWNDPTVVPKTINDDSKDARVGEPWDWFAFPHK